jgi:hypothetical protein
MILSNQFALKYETPKMKSNLHIILIFSVLALISSISSSGQLTLSAYLDMGTSQVSDGFFLINGDLVHYTKGKFETGAGVETDLIGRNGSSFSALNLYAERQLSIKDFPIKVRGFFLWNSHPDLINETNWGFFLSSRWSHLSLRLGNEFRSFHFKRSAAEDPGYEQGDFIRENWNLVYSLGYHLRTVESSWDVAIYMTNLDHFLVNQETNPFFSLEGRYGLFSNLELFAEGWYKSSGSFNLSVNYFGIFIRTGAVWKF